MGKTALAVKALWDLVNHSDCPYDVVLWSSLKTERLTVNGHRVLPTGGHEFPHWWPSFLRAGGHESPHQQIGWFVVC